MSVEISADTAVVMKVKGQYLAVSKTAKRFPRSQTRSPGFVLSQLAVLRTTRYSHLRSLRSGAATRLIIPMERDTFQDSAAKLFNVLPSNIRNCSDFKVQCREVNAYLLNNICREQIVSVRRRSLTRLAKLNGQLKPVLNKCYSFISVSDHKEYMNGCFFYCGFTVVCAQFSFLNVAKLTNYL